MAERQIVIFVDDEEPMRHAVRQWLGVAGHDARSFASGQAALEHISPGLNGIVLTDLRMPSMDGMELLRRILEIDPDIPVILMTGQGDIESAVEAMRIGAYDFIEKPFDPERLAQTVRRATEKRRLVLENRHLASTVPSDALRNRILGTSREIERLREAVSEIAATDVSVVLHGETGSGKDLIARCLHELGRRSTGNYVAVNCSAIPDTMVETEMFGHEAGAFTGAAGRRIGKIEHANGGTLLLDEVESMPLTMQAKLLRALQERVIERLGSNSSIPVDFRTIAATKRDLKAESNAGAFRSDLYFRLSVVELTIPPLRDRRDDIPLLFEYFAGEAARSHNREPRPLKGAALDALIRHDWPGNVRELRNVAERHALGLSSFAASDIARPIELADVMPLTEQLEAFERRIIERALADSGGRISEVMEKLGVPRRTLNEKMTRLGIRRREAEDQNRQ
ncbi:sigma-54-dependent transcriptional regulator [Pelagibacterium halotolerans]|uniref:C4-dicarboxylate transport transcriptional regulatory protein n=1 Tax=Pelagibacterium halotolerans (strain DSM 22347 / JCM 15775 / CGMCC 1.7692 / B2) TaxID=1082931 RepID=G4RCQ4_PELHB|nr:sigma-54 dependent transcriptional regulator [Pelagibacterium halotolerans]AEQ51709.1 C4-dicarboxylate transport transcriptional regulatory protein [Pelagibacterium halotolerans B2]QJR18470.1 sigma-54-dependent Fis family transcriptional regulator [Pelagibacterium halotolerans]SEA21018.1 two-component system, NtrC family, C4-dicarboxylate transport response regulator DctD [Pelagibacterium halotolerans]